jgi:hypothetical protein
LMCGEYIWKTDMNSGSDSAKAEKSEQELHLRSTENFSALPICPFPSLSPCVKTQSQQRLDSR